MGKRVSLVVVALVAALAPGAGVAEANQGNGAIVFDQRGCTEFATAIVCVDTHTVFNSVATPSGNFVGVFNQVNESSFTGTGTLAGCNNSLTNNTHQDSLQQDVETQEFHFMTRGQFSFSCFGFTLNCTFDVFTHFAQGQFQPGRTEFNCS